MLKSVVNQEFVNNFVILVRFIMFSNNYLQESGCELQSNHIFVIKSIKLDGTEAIDLLNLLFKICFQV